MLKSEVKIGETYLAKVGGRTCRVKILQEKKCGGWRTVWGDRYPTTTHWLATNLETGRQVEIRSAAKLHCLTGRA